jgi:branched-chain amino acid transport system substrate-binding protein
MRTALAGVAGAVALLAMSPASADKVTIGFITTLTIEAAAGQHQRDGFELGLDHLNRKLGGLAATVIYEDDKIRPEVGRQAAEKLIKSDKVDFLVGIMWSHVLHAVLPLAAEAKKFLIVTNAGDSRLAGAGCSPWAFRTSFENGQFAETIGRFMQSKGVDNIVAIAPNYQAGKDMVAGLQRAYKGTIVKTIYTKVGQTDLAPELSEIRAAKPGAVFAFMPGGMGIAFVKQWSTAGMAGIPLYSAFTVDGLTLPALGEAAVGSFTPSFWTPDLDNPVSKRFVADFEKKFGYTPSQYSVQSYDAALLLDAAITAVKGDLKDEVGLRAAFRKAGIASPRGTLKFNTNHTPIQNFYLREVVKDSGKVRLATRATVFTDAADSFASECKMAP